MIIETINADITFKYEDFNPKERNNYDIRLLEKFIKDYILAEEVTIRSIKIREVEE